MVAQPSEEHRGLLQPRGDLDGVGRLGPVALGGLTGRAGPVRRSRDEVSGQAQRQARYDDQGAALAIRDRQVSSRSSSVIVISRIGRPLQISYSWRNFASVRPSAGWTRSPDARPAPERGHRSRSRNPRPPSGPARPARRHPPAPRWRFAGRGGARIRPARERRGYHPNRGRSRPPSSRCAGCGPPRSPLAEPRAIRRPQVPGNPGEPQARRVPPRPRRRARSAARLQGAGGGQGVRGVRQDDATRRAMRQGVEDEVARRPIRRPRQRWPAPDRRRPASPHRASLASRPSRRPVSSVSSMAAKRASEAVIGPRGAMSSVASLGGCVSASAKASTTVSASSEPCVPRGEPGPRSVRANPAPQPAPGRASCSRRAWGGTSPMGGR